MIRYKINITGAVQGVGFRPFVYHCATEFNIKGYVQNTPTGVLIEAEADDEQLQTFLLQVQSKKPFLAFIHTLEYSVHDPKGYRDFGIRDSDHNGKKIVTILPDIALCNDCLTELFDPHNRRYLYPFINCTNCGPRFSIIHSVPYDRHNTSMSAFAMCHACEKEYNDPGDRRFHAQPNACPVCGPHIELWNADGDVMAQNHIALLLAAKAIRDGKIIALKGLGGFHLITDARNAKAIGELRKRKHRNEKPFAIMYPSLQMIKADCHVGVIEERLLMSPASPIVLLKRKEGKCLVSDNIAVRNPYLGVMLPYTPLHHLLMDLLNFPVVATSGNLSEEPICIDEYEALERLQHIADLFVISDRRIVRPVDDSVARIIAGREQVLRRSRGYAPLPLQVDGESEPAIAMGAQLKNNIAIINGKNIFISQHLGDLGTGPAFVAFKKAIADLKGLYEVEPTLAGCDLHPEYLSSKYAGQVSDHVIPVQHHYAHVLSCMADNELEGRALGVSWDGTGYGTDGTIWGSEFLLINEMDFQRTGHFRYFGLPGGEAAMRQPRRSALGLLFEIFGDDVFDRHDLIPVQSFSEGELAIAEKMLKAKINTPAACSAGRLFDAVASLIGVKQQMDFEGQAAMQLEFLTDENIHDSYPFIINHESTLIIDWQPLILEVIEDLKNDIGQHIIASRFHNTMAEIIVAMACRINEPNVLLTGGCFQNKYLVEKTIVRLHEQGFQPYWHQRIPPNDGGISVGQLISISKLKRRESTIKMEDAV